MSVRVHNADTLLANRRTRNVEQAIPFRLDGQQLEVVKRIASGEMDTYELEKALGEMLTTPALREELLRKVVLDVELGRETTPILYSPIYDTITDRNFPEIFDAVWAQWGVVVFLQHLELEEVKFGHMRAEQGPQARVLTYSAGFEYTEDMQEYNQTYLVDEFHRALGEAYNALLNHIHLYPIIGFGYGKAANKTAAVYVDPEGKAVEDADDAHPVLSLRETLRTGISDAKTAKRPGNVLLVSDARVDHIREAMSGMHVRGTDWASLTGITDIIGYDGWEAKVGKRSYKYDGVGANDAYLIRPKRGFKELVKHGLLIDANMGDLSRLVEAQIVGRTRRGVFAAVEENVQKITLPSFDG